MESILLDQAGCQTHGESGIAVCYSDGQTAPAWKSEEASLEKEIAELKKQLAEDE